VCTGFWLGNPRERLGRLRRRWEDNTKIDLQQVGWGVLGLDRSGSG
jgi:hypothetical protein